MDPRGIGIIACIQYPLIVTYAMIIVIPSIFALELWLSTDTSWDDPPRSEQELLQQIQSTEPHFIRSLPACRIDKSLGPGRLFLGSKKGPNMRMAQNVTLSLLEKRE